LPPAPVFDHFSGKTLPALPLAISIKGLQKRCKVLEAVRYAIDATATGATLCKVKSTYEYDYFKGFAAILAVTGLNLSTSLASAQDASAAPPPAARRRLPPPRRSFLRRRSNLAASAGQIGDIPSSPTSGIPDS